MASADDLLFLPTPIILAFNFTDAALVLRKKLTCHLHLAHQVHILLFVFLCDQNIGSIWFKVSDFTYPKLLDLHIQSKTVKKIALDSSSIFKGSGN